MPKLPASILSSQRAILRRSDAAEPGITNRRIAQVMGVDHTVVSKWITDTEDGREIGWGALRKAADAWGWDRVLGEDATAAGFGIAKVADTDLDLDVAASRMARSVLALAQMHAEATSADSPGGHAYTEAEAMGIAPALPHAIAAIESVIAALPATKQAEIKWGVR